jgi:hypothetical protein
MRLVADMEEPLAPPAGLAAAPLMPWYRDFAWRDGRLEIRKTAIRLPVDRHLLAEVANWAVWLVLLQMAAAWARRTRRSTARLAFVPDKPRPWYLLGGAALWAGIECVDRQSEADAVVYFDDVTQGQPPASLNAQRLNFACIDISKSHVARIFEAVFGYPLLVDPETARGDIVVKSERNGVHDGRIITAPTDRRDGYCYQRLIDTMGPDGLCRDLRTPCVGGQPAVVWIKLKPAGHRFSIHNRKALLRKPAEVYSPEELALIAAFNARMGLDWGGLDILRDRDGRLYIVDVNKTDVGPVIALSWRDKIISMNRLSKALKQLIMQRIPLCS